MTKINKLLKTKKVLYNFAAGTGVVFAIALFVGIMIGADDITYKLNDLFWQVWVPFAVYLWFVILILDWRTKKKPLTLGQKIAAAISVVWIIFGLIISYVLPVSLKNFPFIVIYWAGIPVILLFIWWFGESDNW